MKNENMEQSRIIAELRRNASATVDSIGVKVEKMNDSMEDVIKSKSKAESHKRKAEGALEEQKEYLENRTRQLRTTTCEICNDRSNTHEYQCKHIICRDCDTALQERAHREGLQPLCPHCREPIVSVKKL